jgi:hypothetical protein
MKGTHTLVTAAVVPAEGSTPVNPETAMARMEAVATMVAPVFLTRQGSANCSASWCRGEAGFGGAGFCGVACAGVWAGAGVVTEAGESAACAVADWGVVRASARASQKPDGRSRKWCGRRARGERWWVEFSIGSKPRPARRFNSSVKLDISLVGTVRPEATELGAAKSGSRKINRPSKAKGHTDAAL